MPLAGVNALRALFIALVNQESPSGRKGKEKPLICKHAFSSALSLISKGYYALSLNAINTRLGPLLLSNEVLTGLRLNPKYFKVKPDKDEIIRTCCVGQRLETKNELLDLLTCWPVANSYFCKKVRKA